MNANNSAPRGFVTLLASSVIVGAIASAVAANHKPILKGTKKAGHGIVHTTKSIGHGIAQTTGAIARGPYSIDDACQTTDKHVLDASQKFDHSTHNLAHLHVGTTYTYSVNAPGSLEDAVQQSGVIFSATIIDKNGVSVKKGGVNVKTHDAVFYKSDSSFRTLKHSPNYCIPANPYLDGKTWRLRQGNGFSLPPAKQKVLIFGRRIGSGHWKFVVPPIRIVREHGKDVLRPEDSNSLFRALDGKTLDTFKNEEKQIQHGHSQGR